MAQMPPLSLGPMPGVPTRQAPERAAGLIGSPLPPERSADLSSPAEAVSQADMPAANAVPIQGQAPEGPSFLDRLGSGISKNGDLLIGLGTGLMSTHGFGNGLSAGFQNAQKASALTATSDLAKAELALKQQKLAKEGQGQNATRAYLISKGLDANLADAAMTNPTILSSTLSQLNKDPSVVQIGGQKYSLKPGEKPTEANLLGPAEAEKDKATLVDVPQPDGSTQKVWLKPGETAGVPIGAPERSGNSNVAVVTEERRKVADSLGWKPESDQYKSFVATGKLPKEDQQTLTVTDKNAILEADEAVNANRSTIGQLRSAIDLSKKAFSGPLASQRGYVASLMGSEAGIATENLTNTVTGQALENLKATFGGAPTEGERKILLDVQGAASQAPEVREEIYRRAIAAAERRMKFNEDRASQLRGGTYYKTPQAGSAPATAAPTGPATSAPSGAPARPQSKSDYDALSSGAQYIAPDGSVRTKP
jgi:hypothetical protein